MAVNLDTRLPMSAITGPLNPADMLMKAQQFQQQQQANALQQRLAELRANREADLLARRERAGKSAYERLQGIQQGIPAQIDTVPQPVNMANGMNQPAYGATMQVERPAVPGRELTPEDYSREMVNALFQQGDYEGAFEAMKNIKSGQQQQMRAYGADFKIGNGGEYYAPNLTTGRLEPTGIYAPEKTAQPKVQMVKTARGIEAIDMSGILPGTVLPAPVEQQPSLTPYQQWQVSESEKKSGQARSESYKAVDQLDLTLAEYRKELANASRADLANPLSDKAQRLGSLATQLQMAYKTAAELGAITGPDWAIINRIVSTPTSMLAIAKGPGMLRAQLDEVEKLAKRDRSILDSKYGTQRKGNSAYQEYLDAYNRATTPEQKRAITERARKLGVVK